LKQSNLCIINSSCYQSLAKGLELVLFWIHLVLAFFFLVFFFFKSNDFLCCCCPALKNCGYILCQAGDDIWLCADDIPDYSKTIHDGRGDEQWREY
jgi:hypothetical protein